MHFQKFPNLYADRYPATAYPRQPAYTRFYRPAPPTVFI